MNRNFLLSFLILSILIPHQNSLAEWTEVVTNKAGNTYVDLDNIKKVDDFVFFWAVTDFLKPLENQYFSSKVFHQIDCKLFRYKDLNMYFHKEPMGKGIALEVKPAEKWHYTEKKTTIEVMVRSVCDYVRHNLDITSFNAL